MSTHRSTLRRDRHAGDSSDGSRQSLCGLRESPPVDVAGGRAERLEHGASGAVSAADRQRDDLWCTASFECRAFVNRAATHRRRNTMQSRQKLAIIKHVVKFAYLDNFLIAVSRSGALLTGCNR